MFRTCRWQLVRLARTRNTARRARAAGARAAITYKSGERRAGSFSCVCSRSARRSDAGRKSAAAVAAASSSRSTPVSPDDKLEMMQLMQAARCTQVRGPGAHWPGAGIELRPGVHSRDTVEARGINFRQLSAVRMPQWMMHSRTASSCAFNA